VRSAAAPPEPSLVFGPVPSRRLGRSLGVNTIPYKVCSYSCAYCQVGRTDHFETERRAFFPPEQVFASVQDRVRELRDRGERLDYVSIVPDGEPTLDANLGRCIRLLKTLGVPVAVITNASLLTRSGGRTDLAAADWVSVKVDAVRQRAWKGLNRPHRSLALDEILEGVRAFRSEYRGRFVTETMLVAGLNDGDEDVDAVAASLARLAPETAYFAVPTRPPADARVRPSSGIVLTRAHELLAALGQHVELLTAIEGDSFWSSGDPVADLLAITAVHPMRRAAVEALLGRANTGWSVVQELLTDNRLTETHYAGETYYLRNFIQTRCADAQRRVTMPRGDGTGPAGGGAGGRRGMGGRGAGGGGRGAGRGGPSGVCVCPKCRFEAPHERGTPCASLSCPKCGTLMTRA
jgi:wyosine [tRNA(Phe)-imidazoG37] synthetase (radical SAM superfamily)